MHALLSRSGTRPRTATGRTDSRPLRVLRHQRGALADPHADRIPPARGAGGPAQQGAVAPRLIRTGVAPRRDRPRQHARRLHRAGLRRKLSALPDAPTSSRSTASATALNDELPREHSRATRTVAAVGARCTDRCAGRAHTRFQPRAGRSPRQPTQTAVAQARAIGRTRIPARLARPNPPARGSRRLQPRHPVWVFQGQQDARAAAYAWANDAAAAAIAAVPQLYVTSRARAPGSTHSPWSQAGRRLGAVVAGVSLAPYRADPRVPRSSLHCLAALFCRRRTRSEMADRQGAAPGRADDPTGGGVERARP